jgi:LAO/AO transport system kinase
MDPTDPEELARRVAGGDRRALARAITLVESVREDTGLWRPAPCRTAPAGGGAPARALGNARRRKVPLIEALGCSSPGRGGAWPSLPWTRPRPARAARSWATRPGWSACRASPWPSSDPRRGGAARRRGAADPGGGDALRGGGLRSGDRGNRGGGQSETMVADLADVFAMVLAPHGGDDLQGVKRGGDGRPRTSSSSKQGRPRPAAAHTRWADYAGRAPPHAHAARQDPEGVPGVLAVSALTGEGLAVAWAAVERLHAGGRRTALSPRPRRPAACAGSRRSIARGPGPPPPRPAPCRVLSLARRGRGGRLSPPGRAGGFGP